MASYQDNQVRSEKFSYQQNHITQASGHCGSSCLRIFPRAIVDLAACAFSPGHHASSCLRILFWGILDPAARVFSFEVWWIQLFAHSPPGHRGPSCSRILFRGIMDPAFCCAFSSEASWIQLLVYILLRSIVDPAAHAFSSKASWIQLLADSLARRCGSLLI